MPATTYRPFPVIRRSSMLMTTCIAPRSRSSLRLFTRQRHFVHCSAHCSQTSSICLSFILYRLSQHRFSLSPACMTLHFQGSLSRNGGSRGKVSVQSATLLLLPRNAGKVPLCLSARQMRLMPVTSKSFSHNFILEYKSPSTSVN